MRMLRFRCALSGFWGFTSTVRPAFGNLTSYLVWSIWPAITAAYTSQGLECPFHIRVYLTRVIASCAWLRGMSIQKICFAAGWSSQNTLPGFTSWTVSPWPPKCCRWVTDSRLCYLYSYVFAASHSNYSVQPFMLLLLLLSALYSVQLQLYNVYSIVYHHVLCWLLFNTVISVQPSHNAVVFASAPFLSAAYVITDQICKFRIPGL